MLKLRVNRSVDTNWKVRGPSICVVSFPGSCVWAEKKKPGTHCLRMLSSPRISGNLRKICSVTLTSERCADFSHIKDTCHWPRSVWKMTKKRRSSSLAGIVHAFVYSSKTLQHVTDAISSFEVHHLLQMKQCRQLPSKWYYFWLKNCRYVSQREYNHAVRTFSR